MTSSTSDRYAYPPQEARQVFGRTITAWAVKNGWIHSTLHEWGEQAGFPAVRDSSFNKLQHAKTDQPQPLTFIQLALANARVAAGDYSGVSDRRLKDRLKGSLPICDESGRPWRATEFFSHFIGELEAPEWLQLPRIPTPEEALELSQLQRGRFEQAAAARGLAPAQAWRQFEMHCGSLSKAQKDLLRDVLAGWHTWSPEELDAVTSDGVNLVDEALLAWETTNTGAGSRKKSRS